MQVKTQALAALLVSTSLVVAAPTPAPDLGLHVSFTNEGSSWYISTTADGRVRNTGGADMTFTGVVNNNPITFCDFWDRDRVRVQGVNGGVGISVSPPQTPFFIRCQISTLMSSNSELSLEMASAAELVSIEEYVVEL